MCIGSSPKSPPPPPPPPQMAKVPVSPEVRTRKRGDPNQMRWQSETLLTTPAGAQTAVGINKVLGA